MRRQIGKHAGVFAAIVVLVLAAAAIGGYILSNQRFYLPAWVPGVGTDFYELKAELPTAQAVVPGQGQSVNVAGVKVGEIGGVELEGGHAVVSMQIKQKYKPVYRDATILLRPRTGLKDMFLALDPGTKAAGALPEGASVRVANTLPDVNPDEVLAQLDGDTRTYLEILLDAGGQAFTDDAAAAEGQTASQDLRETLKRFEPLARNGRRLTAGLIERRRNLERVIHNFQLLSTELASKDRQLAALVDSSNANFGALADEQGSPAPGAAAVPGGAEPDDPGAELDRRAGGRARPGAAGAAPVRAQARARAAQDAAVPARDDADRARPDPSLRARHPADRARPARRRAAACPGHAAPGAHVRRAEQGLQRARLRAAGRRRLVPVLGGLERARGDLDVHRPGRPRADPPRRRADQLPRATRCCAASSPAIRVWACSRAC